MLFEYKNCIDVCHVHSEYSYPHCSNTAVCESWAQDRKKWKVRVHSVRLGSRTAVALQTLFAPEQEFIRCSHLLCRHEFTVGNDSYFIIFVDFFVEIYI